MLSFKVIQMLFSLDFRKLREPELHPAVKNINEKKD